MAAVDQERPGFLFVSPRLAGFGLGGGGRQKDLKNLEFHMLDTGHFALEEKGQEIANHMLKFQIFEWFSGVRGYEMAVHSRNKKS